MALVLAGAGVDQDDVMRRSDYEGLVRNDHLSQRRVENLRLHRGQMTVEYRSIVHREEILRPPPRPFALDHRIDGDVADPDLPHFRFPRNYWGERNEQLATVQAEGRKNSSSKLRLPKADE